MIETETTTMKIDSIPLHFVEKSVNPKFYPQNHFFLFLMSLFGKTIAYDLSRKYLIRTSEYWKGATVFWQIDDNKKIRQCKIMLYDAVSGKRVRKGETVYRFDKANQTHKMEVTESSCVIIYGKFINEVTRNLNLVQCFFGQELLGLFPDKPVCIVESEKTAIICSVYLPHFLWLATGGSNGCKWREYDVYRCLRDRAVTFFPDYGYFKQDGTTCYDEWRDRVMRIKEALNNPNIKVSDVLERALNGQPRDGRDLADLLLIRDESTGIALTQDGYPLMWDFKSDM